MCSGGGGLLLTGVFLWLNISIPYWGIGAREILASCYMIIGFGYKKTELLIENYKPYIVIPLCAFFVGLGVEFWQCGMLVLTISKYIPYSITAFIGIIMVFSLSKIILQDKKVEKFFIFVGNNTLTILTWHFIAFKVVSLFLIYIYSLPIVRLAEFPVIEVLAYNGWWVLYSIIGICLPLSVCKLYNYKQ